MRSSFLFILYIPLIVSSQDVFPTWTQFSCTVQITSHLLDNSQKYPPSIQTFQIHYDAIQEFIRIDVLNGYEAGKTYMRRYDLVRIKMKMKRMKMIFFNPIWKYSSTFFRSKNTCGKRMILPNANGLI